MMQNCTKYYCTGYTKNEKNLDLFVKIFTKNRFTVYIRAKTSIRNVLKRQWREEWLGASKCQPNLNFALCKPRYEARAVAASRWGGSATLVKKCTVEKGSRNLNSKKTNLILTILLSQFQEFVTNLVPGTFLTALFTFRRWNGESTLIHAENSGHNEEHRKILVTF
jgi:hypothetical protein